MTVTVAGLLARPFAEPLRRVFAELRRPPEPPERVARAIVEAEAVSEVLVGWVQLSGVALFFLLLRRRGPRAAGLAAVLLQLLPASFVYFSEGTLSNVFGQATSVLFFA